MDNSYNNNAVHSANRKINMGQEQQIKQKTIMSSINCCVPNCDASLQKNFYVKFYEIPSCPATRKLWLTRARYPEQTISPWASVCSLHFEGGSKTTLVDTPSIFPWSPEWTDVVTTCNQRALAWFERRIGKDHRYGRKPPLLTINTGHPFHPSLLSNQEDPGQVEGIDWQLQAWPVAITQNVHAQVGPQQSHNELTEDKLQVTPVMTIEGGRRSLDGYANPRFSTLATEVWTSSNTVTDAPSHSAGVSERPSSPGEELLIRVVKESNQSDEICHGPLPASLELLDSTTLKDSYAEKETLWESFYTFHQKIPATAESHGDDISKKVYRCKFCKNVLPDRSVLSLNKSLSCGRVILSYYACEECSRCFVGSQYSEHFFRGGKLPRRNKAQEKLSTSGGSSVRTPSLIYTKLYVCEFCREGFTTPSRLRLHLPTHSA